MTSDGGAPRDSPAYTIASPSITTVACSIRLPGPSQASGARIESAAARRVITEGRSHSNLTESTTP